MKDKKFIALASVFFLLFFAAIVTTTLNKPLSNLLRAKNVNPSPLKSFAVVFPQTSTVGNKIKVSVYIRDVNGAVLPNRSVTMSSSLSSVSFAPSDTQLTNELGMAQFSMSSTTAGKIQLTAVDAETKTSVVNIPTAEFTQ